MKQKMMRLLCLLVVFSLLAGWYVPNARVEASGDTLKVYVAYWGQNHAQPILKETFSRSELAALGTVTVQYTAYDKGSFCRYADAEGVLLEEVLYAANINFWGADSLHFYTTDEPGGYETPYYLSYLFADRYNCWFLDSTKVFDASGVYGGYYEDCGSKTDAEMKDPAFAAILGGSFNVDSTNINNGYPVLKFQGGTAAPAIYTVTIPASGEGYTVSIADGYTTTVVEGGEFKFSVYLLDPYQIVSVMEGETELTAVDGVYTIENITSDVTVTITVACGHSYEHGECTVCGEANPDYIIASGWSGYTTWNLNKDGVLTFAPTDMKLGGQCNLRNYCKVNGVLTLPWGAYADMITAVVIEDGISDIGQMAFYELKNLESVTFGADVVEIRGYAFKNCVSLTTVTGTENLQNICQGAFYGCSALSELEILEGCVIGSWAFTKSGVTVD